MGQDAQENTTDMMDEDNNVIALELPPHEQDRILEAVLFASPEPMTIKAINERLSGWQASLIEESLQRLVEQYDGRGIQLVLRGEAWAFRTAPDLSSYLRLERTLEKKLSRAAMETLAIIAYHQPVTRAEIENIRGVAVGKGTLDLLIEAGWVQPGRRREIPGRPLTWKTTSAFLDHFGLESLNDLPGLDDLKASGLLDRRPSFEIVPDTMEMFEDEDEREDDNEAAEEHLESDAREDDGL